MSSSESPEPKSALADQEQKVTSTLVGKGLFGGFLMGLANLVPGISGGTMLLASGIYPAFIESLSSLTRLRFNWRSIVVMVSVVVAAGLAVVLLAGTLKSLVVQQRWIMYSLFIGLTLGGIPIVWRMAKERNAKLWVPASIAFSLMALMAYFDSNQFLNQAGSNFVLLFLAGLAGASAMILPGLSGAYLLLLMGQYVAILDAVDEFKEALKSGDIAAAMTPAWSVLLPVGIGVILGVVVVGNLFKWLLANYRTQTLGMLLGLLLGSVVGLYPFQQGVRPQPGDKIKGQVVTEANIDTFDEDEWPTKVFTPAGSQPLVSIGLIVLGLATTTGVSLLGDSEEK